MHLTEHNQRWWIHIHYWLDVRDEARRRLKQAQQNDASDIVCGVYHAALDHSRNELTECVSYAQLTY